MTVEDSGMALTLVRILTRKCNGEHGSSGSGPGPELFLHRSCPRSPAAYPLEFWVWVREEGYAPPFFSCCDARRAPVWRSRRLFISSVEDPVLYVVRRWSPFATASGSVALS